MWEKGTEIEKVCDIPARLIYVSFHCHFNFCVIVSMSRNKRSLRNMLCLCTLFIYVLVVYMSFFLSLSVTKVFNRLVQEINKDADENHSAVYISFWTLSQCVCVRELEPYQRVFLLLVYGVMLFIAYFEPIIKISTSYFIRYILMCVSANFTSTGREC